MIAKKKKENPIFLSARVTLSIHQRTVIYNNVIIILLRRQSPPKPISNVFYIVTFESHPMIHNGSILLVQRGAFTNLR